jgi:hypothetical protein
MCLDRTSEWQECVREEAVHLMVDRKQRKRKGLNTGLTFKCMLPVTHFLQLDPPPKFSRTF